MLSLLPSDRNDQRIFVTIYTALGAVARPIIAVLALRIVDETSSPRFAPNLSWVLTIGLFCVASASLLEIAVRKDQGLTAVPVQATPRGRWPAEMKWIFAATALHAGALYMMSRLFLFTPVRSDNGHAGAWLLILWSVGLAAGPLLRILSIRASFPLAVGVAGIFACLIFLPSMPVPIRLAAALIYGAALSLSGAELLNAVARLTTEHGGSSGGMVFAAYAVVIKIAMAVGNGGLAFLLDGYSVGSWASSVALVVIHIGGAVCCMLAWQRSQLRPAGLGAQRVQGARSVRMAGHDSLGEAV
jgi:ABC-type multidrug transport system permease subunit